MSASYDVEIGPGADRAFRRLPAAIRERIQPAILALELDPRPRGVTRLQGIDAYRIRIGEYRVIYTIQDQLLRVLVIRIAHRRESYRRL